ncbi:MAG: SDR family NAD(P)-dependent oxidoreductase [Acidobacteriota bacterium]|nr:SDR family NAD(P)-dependent oxidoreductase [Acidobacteriota bacterium]
MTDQHDDTQYDGSEIAIVGMTCRFPGADTVERYWQNLRQGLESLKELSDEELLTAGVAPELVRNPRFVRRASVVEGIEELDAEFFGYTPLEAKLMDPQHRLFLECAWEIFEQAGYDPERLDQRVGVFTGAKTNTYLFSLFSNRELFNTLDNFQIALGNDLAVMATRIAHKFDLRGPAYALHTACSTSLVAVHLAVQSLLLNECRMAVAGGACVNVPQKTGYLYQEGGLLSPDGSCRTFDAEAAGSNFGNGAGAVLLKRLEDAIEDGDTVYAIIRGSATNNDGAAKASFTAPGVQGQTDVLLDAMAIAGVRAEDISYVETHGTATDLGDSIEMLALTQAFRADTEAQGFCGVGSVKTNLGHLETAAGVAGLIKTALALYHQELPPSLHFHHPNPKIDFAASPFRVVDHLEPWPRGDKPRIAGVSSFGIGSTNAHVIVEEAPVPKASPAPVREHQLLLVSARTATARDALSERLADHLEELEERGEEAAAYLADAAWSLQVGRKRFPFRRALVVQDTAGAVAALRGEGEAAAGFDLEQRQEGPPVVFLFPGLGEHYPGMAHGLYRGEPAFREALDHCAEVLEQELGQDLRPLLFPEGEEETTAAAPDLKAMLGRGSGARKASPLDDTRIAQPAVFAVEYALAQLWASWGIEPTAVLGYSLGEYVAACVAGVLPVDDALRLVARRAAKIAELEAGAMIALPLDESAAAPYLERHGLSLAGVNGPVATVAAGSVPAVEDLEKELDAAEIVYRRLPTTHAFHSSMMEPLADEVTRLAGEAALSTPEIPLVSNVTGTWMTDEEATDPAYWARHLVSPVRFGDAARTLLEAGPRVLLEVGPGQGLASFVKQHPEIPAERSALAFPSLRNLYTRRPDGEVFLTTLGKLWAAGADVDWAAVSGPGRRRVPLPTYPFERQRHWVDLPLPGAGEALPSSSGHGAVTLDKRQDLAEWFYRPEWAPLALDAAAGDAPFAAGAPVLVFADAAGMAEALGRRLAGEAPVVVVEAGEEFRRLDGEASRFTLGAAEPGVYSKLLEAATEAAGTAPGLIVHGWALDAPASFAEAQERGFYSLLFLAQALGRQSQGQPGRGQSGRGQSGRAAAVHLEVLGSGLAAVTGGETPDADRALLLGPARVAPQEMPGLSCRVVDLPRDLPRDILEAEAGDSELLDALTEAAALPVVEPVLALRRGEDEWTAYRRDYREEPLAAMEEMPSEEMPSEGSSSRLRDGGVYLLTGGLGGLGLEVARHLAQAHGAKLVLTGRSPLPPREEWQEAAQGDDSTAQRLRSVLALEEAGTEVLALAADVTDEEAMASVLDQTFQRFGRLDGVIHLAGIPGGGIIQLKTRAMAEAIVGPKVQGARVLLSLLDGLAEDRRPGFLLLFSSIASVLGEFGQADYCGANAYLDAVAEAAAAEPRGYEVLAVNWDIWNRVGLAVYTEVPEHLKAWRAEMLDKAMTPEEGVEALDRILAGDAGRLVVSTQELEGRMELGRSFTGERFLEELGLGGAAGVSAAAGPSASVAEGSASGAAGGASTGVLAGGQAALERQLSAIWQRILGVDSLNVEDNFFDLGGNSLLGLQLVQELGRQLDLQVPPVALFEHPTVASLARHLLPDAPAASAASQVLEERRRVAKGAAKGEGHSDIAIIATTGRFPGARNTEELWKNLLDGEETVTFFTDEELLEAGISRELVDDPRYVKAGSILEDVDLFDAGLFGYSPREAEVMDPQHRVFLECSWEALERAGYDPETYAGDIGVYAGSNLSTYLLQMHADPRVRASVNMLQAILGNDKDSLTTTVSYKLNLTGPSVAVQTFCSTSLVAVHMAAQALRSGECDMALAGGIRIVTPVRQGYLYEQGGIAPPDGHSRSFDAGANGSVLGQGVGVVVLKRLSEALEDGDPVFAVIKGSAINNDGATKAGYTAPSVAGQSRAVEAAYRDSGIDPSTISYLEAHGSATELGDPIEVAALTKAYRAFTDQSGFCRIGSIKANFGHLDRAAGVAGLIKTTLALSREELPPNILFETPNPKIDFEHSPFRVITERTPWPRGETPRRAAVNSLGMGGTNVHVVLEEAPEPLPTGPAGEHQLLVLSARSDTALEAATANLAQWLREHPDAELADVAWTLQVGRRNLPARRAVVASSVADAVEALAGDSPRRRLTGWCEDGEREVAFLFPGLGGQYQGMGQGLYDSDATFRNAVDRCAEILQPILGEDLRSILFEADRSDGESDEDQSSAEGEKKLDFKAMLRRGSAQPEGPLARTRFAHPALFVVQYALARLWQSWGLKPSVLLGYSLGEYVAAVIGGTLELADALQLVARRAQLIEELAPGGMLAVALPEAEAAKHAAEVSAELAVSAVNGPEQTVVAGPAEAVQALEEHLAQGEVASRRLQAERAFHSPMMEPVAQAIEELVAGFQLTEPKLPWISNVTGAEVKPEDAVDPAYWARHTLSPVRFTRGIEVLLAEPGRILVELGPGQTLASLVLQHPAAAAADPAVARPSVVGALRHDYERDDDVAFALGALAKAWLAGARPDWPSVHGGERRRRVVLPTYPFERQRYWIVTSEPGAASASARAGSGRTGGAQDVAASGALAVPGWRRTEPPPASGEVAEGRERWWLLHDPATDDGFGEEVAARLEERGAFVRRIDAVAGTELVTETAGEMPAAILDLRTTAAGIDGCEQLLALAEALAEADQQPELWLVGCNFFEVVGTETVDPAAAAVAGAAATLGHRLGLSLGVVDVDAGAAGSPRRRRAVAQLVGEVMVAPVSSGAGAMEPPVAAFRGPHRWRPTVELVAEPTIAGELSESALAGAGFHLLFDGLGDPGFVFAEALAETGAALVTVEPAGFPAREEWDGWLDSEAGASLLAKRIRRARALEERGVKVRVVDPERTDGAALAAVLDAAGEEYGELGAVVDASSAPVEEDAAAGLDHLRRVAGGLDVLAEATADARAVLLVADAAVDATAAGSGVAASSLLLEARTSLESAAAEAGRWSFVAWAPSDEARAARLLAAAVADAGRRWLVLGAGAPSLLPLVSFRREAEAPEESAVGSYERPALRVEFVAPRNDLERTIAGAWTELLGVERIGVHDHFLELGGDSLLASRLVTRLRELLELELPIRLLFEAPTVEELAQHVEELRRAEEDKDLENLLERVKGLSEEELEAELSKREAALGVEET